MVILIMVSCLIYLHFHGFTSFSAEVGLALNHDVTLLILTSSYSPNQLEAFPISLRPQMDRNLKISMFAL